MWEFFIQKVFNSKLLFFEVFEVLAGWACNCNFAKEVIDESETGVIIVAVSAVDVGFRVTNIWGLISD